MRRFRRRRRFSTAGWRLWGLLLPGALLLLFWVTDLMLLGPLAVVAETEARHRAVAAIHRVVLGTVGESLKPEDVVVYTPDQTGSIAAYHINTRLVNQVAAQAVTSVKDEFKEITGQPVQIPLGALTGSRLLGAIGPRIPVQLVPIGSVGVDIIQAFTDKGINQTRHTVSLRTTATVRILLPLVSREVQVSSDYPIADTVIVGKVPNVYGANVGGVTLPVTP